MGRRGCCNESDLKKGPWSHEEDEKLITHVQNHGCGNWRAVPKLAGIDRNGKCCRLRWMNYLRPDIKRGNITLQEQQTILNLHSALGNKWSTIARQLPGRTDNEIKNFWNTHLKKKLIHMGFDPTTHHPRTDLSSSLVNTIGLAALKQLIHNPSWEEHVLRLMYSDQTLPYIQYLHQPLSLTNINNNNNNNPTNEIEIMNLINSNPSSPQMMTQNNNNNPLQVQPLGTDSVGFLFSHSPSLEMIPNNTNTCQTALFVGKEMCTQNNDGVPDPNYIIDDGRSSSNANCGDACSSSSFVGSSASIWSDHLLLPSPPHWL